MLAAEEEKLARALWLDADLSWLCRPHGQLDLYNFVQEREQAGDSLRTIVFKCHRRFGKSLCMLLLLVKRCLSQPGQRCVFGAPTLKQVKSIAIPNLGIILRTCPEDLRPRHVDDRYVFHNPRWPAGSQPSELSLVGVDIDRGDRLRGAWADAVALDEVRDMTEPRYLVEDVLMYQFVGRPNAWLAMASTPPRSGDHEFESYFCSRAQKQGTYREFTVESNADWSQEDEKLLLEAIGEGKDSISWQREALCRAVGDENELILPEFQRREAGIVQEAYERPGWFYPYTCLDTGWTDWNAALFGYVDWKAQKLVVEDELVMRYQSTGQIASGIKAKELDLWKSDAGGWVGGKRPARIGDLTEQALEDMAVDHAIGVAPVEKYDRDGAIANLRSGIQDGRLVIHPRCKNLIYQCRNGIWNKQRTQFERSKTIGHCDALAALVYLYRMANWTGNPYPERPVEGDHFWDPDKMLRKRRKLEGLKKIVSIYK